MTPQERKQVALEKLKAFIAELQSEMTEDEWNEFIDAYKRLQEYKKKALCE